MSEAPRWRGERLAELTWPEAGEAAAAGAVVLLPVGSTEAHGPHLPLATDVIISEELARRAAGELAAAGVATVTAPSLAYAVTDFAAPFAGTISLAPATATALFAGVARELARHGFARLCLVNSHLEPAHVGTLRSACAELAAGGQRIAFPDVLERRWGRTLSDEYKRGACHAGSYETSLVLAARPELVRSSRGELPSRPIDLAAAIRSGIHDFVAAGADQAYFGDPAAATAEEGESLYRRLVTMVVTTVLEVWPELASRPSG